MLRLPSILLVTLLVLISTPSSHAQIDPEKRRLVEFGYNQPLEGRAPIAGYAYYYFNEPDYPRTNQTLRLVIAPVYLDGELGFRKLLGENTDFALGLSGGGFADSFSEIRGGHFYEEESFTGHGAGVSASVYHLFNPGQLIPLNGLMRVGVHQTLFERDEDTAPSFVVPRALTTLSVRTGLRFGGREPLLTPNAAMELSLWYEGQFRLNQSTFGYVNEREIKPESHLFWSRALFAYTLPESRHHISMSATVGISLEADRFSSYRLGAALPLNAEFPLTLPGYYYQELTARRFAQLTGLYTLPLGERKQWSVTGFGTTAAIDFLHDMDQPGDWFSGVGGGIGWQSPQRSVEIMLGYAYALDALRDGHHGAQSVGLLVQWDLTVRATSENKKTNPQVAPDKSRFLNRLFSR